MLPFREGQRTEGAVVKLLIAAIVGAVLASAGWFAAGRLPVARPDPVSFAAEMLKAPVSGREEGWTLEEAQEVQAFGFEPCAATLAAQLDKREKQKRVTSVLIVADQPQRFEIVIYDWLAEGTPVHYRTRAACVGSKLRIRKETVNYDDRNRLFERYEVLTRDVVAFAGPSACREALGKATETILAERWNVPHLSAYTVMGQGPDGIAVFWSCEGEKLEVSRMVMRPS